MTGRQKLSAFAGVLGVGVLITACGPRGTNSSPAARSETTKSAGIGCAGRIEPRNGLVRVAARDPVGGIAVVDRVAVVEQQHVSKGQLIATLRGRALAEAALKVSAQRVHTADFKLQQFRAAPKQAELESHAEEIGRRQADHDRAQTELARYEQLRKTQDVSVSDVEAKRADAEMARRSLEIARKDRLALAELRESDAAVLDSEIRVAQAEQSRLDAELRLYNILAPVSGQVLKVFVHDGESAAQDGIAEILEDGPLYAIAEVPEADIFRIKNGAKATVRGELLPLQADGIVESIGRAVAGSEVLTSDPSAFTDRRVVPVKIRLLNFAPSQGLIHARVSVLIQP